MKLSWSSELKVKSVRFWFDVGLYSDEPFKLFCITIGETIDDPVLDFITLFELQIARFCFSIGLKWY